VEGRKEEDEEGDGGRRELGHTLFAVFHYRCPLSDTNFTI